MFISMEGRDYHGMREIENGALTITVKIGCVAPFSGVGHTKTSASRTII